MWLKLLFLLFISSTAFAQIPPTGIQDEGGAETKPVFTINCVGGGIECSHSGKTATLTVAGGGAATAGGNPNELQWNQATSLQGTPRTVGTTTGNIGLGTTTAPSATLEIVKNNTDSPLMVSSVASGDGDYLIIESSGNVGIGTIEPITKLQVNGTVTTTAVTGDGSGLTGITASGLATDSVSADELNATGVEAELEAVMDLQDMQGAVTDGQVPNTITIDNATTAANLGADGVDALTEIAQGIKTAADDTSKLVVGTAGSNGEIAKWNTDGTLTDSNLIVGTLTDTKYCRYNSTGTLLDCNYTCADITGSAALCDGDDATGGAGSSQWQTTAVGIGTTGLVGIGTYGPSGMLEIVKTGSNTNLMISSAMTGDGDFLIVKSDGNVGIGTIAPVGGLVVMNGNVGIGTWSPVYKLQVAGTLDATTITQGGSPLSGSMPAKEFYWPASSSLPLEPADSIPPISKDAGTNSDMLPIDFDSGTDECRTVTFKAPSSMTSGGTVTFYVYWYSASVTTNDVIWDFRHNSGVAEGVDPDAALTTITAAADTVQGTAGQITITSWTETQTNLAWVEGDLVIGEFCRDANNASDTFAADARTIGFAINIPRS